MSMAEWGTFWTASGVVVAIMAGVAGGAKLLWELHRIGRQRERELEQADEEASLKRTEFFLAQHRRLFDDKDLYEVLCYLDGDDEWLLNLEMWDKKRKFLTFIEEIALLVNSNKIQKNVAYYMFGHYARCAKIGANFNVGIDATDSHWWVFQGFCKDSEKFERDTQEAGRETLTL
jgi:hypothetical protein